MSAPVQCGCGRNPGQSCPNPDCHQPTSFFFPSVYGARATKTFDQKCFDLAVAFLADYPSLNTDAARVTLAAHIQKSIEEEISFMESALASGASS